MPVSKHYYVVGIATISWIDPQTGLPEVDSGGSPGPFISRATITAEEGYRFSHFLEAWVTVDSTAGLITGGGFTPASGMYRAPSFLGTPSSPVGTIGRKRTFTRTSATFRQLVGCRTEAPEIIGRFAFEETGVFAPGRGPLAIYMNHRLGEMAAEAFKVFPPIWTELELTISADGGYTHSLLRHSYFPSVSHYVQENVPPGTPYLSEIPDLKTIFQLKSSYDGVPYLDSWYANGWGPVGATLPGTARTLGNPWEMRIPDPIARPFNPYEAVPYLGVMAAVSPIAKVTPQGY